MNIEKIIADMKLARDQYEVAKLTGINISPTKERMQNIAFNYYDDLIDIASKYKEAAEEVEVLNAALADSDAELKKLRDKKKTAAVSKVTLG